MSETTKTQKTIAAQSGMIGFEDITITSDKKFKPRKEFGNLCQGHLVSVEIKETITPNVDDKGVASTYEYRGVPIPTLVFRYQEDRTPDDDVDRFYTDNFRIVTTQKNDGQKLDVKTFTSILQETYRHCRHRLEAYIGTPNFVEPGFPSSINMNGSVGERIDQWKEFCEFFVKAFNSGKNGKPVFVNEKDEPITIWIKLLASYPDRRYLCAPSFVGQGYIERVTGKKPSIEVLHSETIELNSEPENKKGIGAAVEAGTTMGYGSAGTGGMNAEAIAALQNQYSGASGNIGKY